MSAFVKALVAAAVIGTAAATAGVAASWPSAAASQPVQATGPVSNSVASAVIRGRGARVVTTTLPRSSPTIVVGTHTGSSNFMVHFVGGGDTHYVFNEIGRYSGQKLIDDPRKGRYRIAVEADGAWTLRITQPRPTARAKLLPGTVSGRGSRVVPIRTTRDMQPIVTGRHLGRSNFMVHVVGYGNTTGTEYVFNEIGRYRGQKLIDDMPRGSYLVAVEADGVWTLRFTR